jgi:hypothetical protein
MVMPDPLAWLKWFVDLGAEHLALVRVGLHAGAGAIITIHSSMLSHNGPGPLPPGFTDCVVKYPFAYQSRPEVETILAQRYRTELWTDEDEDWPVPEVRMCGYYCRRQSP